jgi:hypothetical protein
LKGLAMIVGTAEPAPCHAAATARRVHAPFANVPLPRLVRVAHVIAHETISATRNS